MTIYAGLVIARWIYFAAAFVLFGSSLFWFYMGSERLSPGPSGLPRALRATTHLLRVTGPVAAISGIAWLAGILANMTGGFDDLVDMQTLKLFFFETQFGAVSFFRLALFAAAIVVALAPWRGRAWFATLLLIGALLLVSQAWLGHAAEGGPGVYGTWMIVVYCLHMFAAGAWVGGLPPLLFALFEQRRRDPQEARRQSFDILSRYSLMAFVAVGLIVISGIVNAGFRVVGSFDKLFDAPYGNVLFAKIAAVVLMLALAYFNRFVAMPRLAAAAAKDDGQILRLRASIAFELVLGLAVLGIAAVLGITPPPQ
jgi:putative copper resistance protein D